MSSEAKQFTEGFEPLPEGDYLVRMNRVTFEPCRNGKMVKAGFQVVNGDYAKRLVFENFLVEHSNPKAEQIGKERLEKYLGAIGVEGGLDAIGHDYNKLEEYLETPFIASLKIEGEREYTAKDGSTQTASATNKIKSFKKR